MDMRNSYVFGNPNMSSQPDHIIRPSDSTHGYAEPFTGDGCEVHNLFKEAAFNSIGVPNLTELCRHMYLSGEDAKVGNASTKSSSKNPQVRKSKRARFNFDEFFHNPHSTRGPLPPYVQVFGKLPSYVRVHQPNLQGALVAHLDKLIGKKVFHGNKQKVLEIGSQAVDPGLRYRNRQARRMFDANGVVEHWAGRNAIVKQKGFLSTPATYPWFIDTQSGIDLLFYTKGDAFAPHRDYIGEFPITECKKAMKNRWTNRKRTAVHSEANGWRKYDVGVFKINYHLLSMKETCEGPYGPVDLVRGSGSYDYKNCRLKPLPLDSPQKYEGVTWKNGKYEWADMRAPYARCKTTKSVDSEVRHMLDQRAYQGFTKFTVLYCLGSNVPEYSDQGATVVHKPGSLFHAWHRIFEHHQRTSFASQRIPLFETREFFEANFKANSCWDSDDMSDERKTHLNFMKRRMHGKVLNAHLYNDSCTAGRWLIFPAHLLHESKVIETKGLYKIVLKFSIYIDISSPGTVDSAISKVGAKFWAETIGEDAGGCEYIPHAMNSFQYKRVKMMSPKYILPTDIPVELLAEEYKQKGQSDFLSLTSLPANLWLSPNMEHGLCTADEKTMTSWDWVPTARSQLWSTPLDRLEKFLQSEENPDNIYVLSLPGRDDGNWVCIRRYPQHKWQRGHQLRRSRKNYKGYEMWNCSHICKPGNLPGLLSPQSLANYIPHPEDGWSASQKPLFDAMKQNMDIQESPLTCNCWTHRDLRDPIREALLGSHTCQKGIHYTETGEKCCDGFCKHYRLSMNIRIGDSNDLTFLAPVADPKDIALAHSYTNVELEDYNWSPERKFSDVGVRSSGAFFNCMNSIDSCKRHRNHTPDHFFAEDVLQSQKYMFCDSKILISGCESRRAKFSKWLWEIRCRIDEKIGDSSWINIFSFLPLEDEVGYACSCKQRNLEPAHEHEHTLRDILFDIMNIRDAGLKVRELRRFGFDVMLDMIEPVDKHIRRKSNKLRDIHSVSKFASRKRPPSIFSSLHHWWREKRLYPYDEITRVPKSYHAYSNKSMGHRYLQFQEQKRTNKPGFYSRKAIGRFFETLNMSDWVVLPPCKCSCLACVVREHCSIKLMHTKDLKTPIRGIYKTRRTCNLLHTCTEDDAYRFRLRDPTQSEQEEEEAEYYDQEYGHCDDPPGLSD